MNKTNKRTNSSTERIITTDIEGLSSMLTCGEATARKIAIDAGARLMVGRRTLYSVDKIRKYINDLSF